MRDPDGIRNHVFDAVMTRYRKLSGQRDRGVWSPTRDEELESLEAFLDALDEGRVTIAPRAP